MEEILPRIHIPHNLLKPYVRRYLLTESKEELPSNSPIIKVKPTGYNYMGWVLDGDIKNVIDDRYSVEIAPNCFFISGQVTTQKIKGYYSGKLCYLVCEFTALGLYQLTGQKGIDYIGMMFNPELSHIDTGIPYENLKSQLKTVSREQKLETALNLFEDALLNLAQNPNEVPEYLTKAVSIIEGSNGQKKISEVSDMVSVSSRQLNRKFNEIIGISPKYFSKVLQMNLVLMAMLTNDEKFFTEAAIEAGYSDQSHLIKVIQEFFNSNPSEFLDSEQTTVFKFLGESRKVN